MNEYIKSLEKEFSLIKRGFKEEEKRALDDYKSNDKEYVKRLAFLSYESKDDNWRVQEVLAKAFDEYCKNKGYENSISVIDEWLRSDNPNTRRAVTEGLRIWTSRPYFKENPQEAIKRIAQLKEDTSEYVRKSVGNALRDISRKFPELISEELKTWNLEIREIKQVYKLASRFVVE